MTAYEVMTVGEMTALRKAAGLSQTAMGQGMGLSIRAYQDLEKGEPGAPIGLRHQRLVEAATLWLAVDRANPMLTTAKVRGLALDLAAMIRGEPARGGA